MARTPTLAPRTRDATRTAKLSDLAIALSRSNSDSVVTCTQARYDLSRAARLIDKAWLQIIDHANGKHS